MMAHGEVSTLSTDYDSMVFFRMESQKYPCCDAAMAADGKGLTLRLSGSEEYPKVAIYFQLVRQQGQRPMAGVFSGSYLNRDDDLVTVKLAVSFTDLSGRELRDDSWGRLANGERFGVR